MNRLETERWYVGPKDRAGTRLRLRSVFDFGKAHAAELEGELLIDPSQAFYSKLLELRDCLRNHGERLVLAESCTSGLVAAEIGKIPGISEFFCGSMVVYRSQSKTDWLGISPDILDDPKFGPVSERTTEDLAKAILKKTPEATVAAAITGHLGPGSPKDMDGRIFCGFGRRDADSCVSVGSFLLQSPAPSGSADLEARSNRQREAALLLLQFILDQWLSCSPSRP